MNQMQTRLLPLLTESLLLLQGILEWDFLWHGNPNAMSSQLKLKPPAGWKTMLLQQKILPEQILRTNNTASADSTSGRNTQDHLRRNARTLLFRTARR